MHPLFPALLSSWEWRVEVLVVLVPLGLLYTIGWQRLRKRSTHVRFATKRRLVAYWSGWALLVTALMSPLDRLGGQLFFMHMIQHLLLIMVAPPLLLLANPLPFLLWGLPAAQRRYAGRGLSQLLHRESRFRNGLRSITAPVYESGVLAFVVGLLGFNRTITGRELLAAADQLRQAAARIGGFLG